MPLYPTAILLRVAELSAHPRSTAIQHPLFRVDEVTRRELGAVVECGCERKRSIGFEIIKPTHEVLPVDRKPVPFHAAVGRPHPVRRLVDRYTRRKRSGREEKHAVGIVQSTCSRDLIGRDLKNGPPGILYTRYQCECALCRRRNNHRTCCVICRVPHRRPAVPTRRCRKAADAYRSCWPRYSAY